MRLSLRKPKIVETAPEALVASRGVFLGAMLITLLPGALGLYWGMREWQLSHWPVAGDFIPDRSSMTLENGVLTLDGTFVKYFRADICEFESMRFFVLVDGALMAVDQNFLDRKKDPRNNNRAKGPQYFHGWQAYVGEWPSADVLYLRIYHRCLGFWPTRTDFAPTSYAILKRPGWLGVSEMGGMPAVWGSPEDRRQVKAEIPR